MGVLFGLSGIKERLNLVGNLSLVSADANLSLLLELLQLFFFGKLFDLKRTFVLLLVKFLLACVLSILTLLLLDFRGHIADSLGFSRVSVAIVTVGIVLDALFFDLIVYLHSLESRSLSVLLPELGLHVGKERARQDADVRDLHSLKVDAPTFDNIAHVLDDLFTEFFSVLDDLVNC